MIRIGAFVLVLALAGTAYAASVDVPVMSSATSPEPGITCNARIMVDPVGTDVMRMQCDGLQPQTIYTVFLGNSPVVGTVPVNFLGQMQSNNKGSGKFTVETEIVSAFVGVNPTLDAADGIADGISTRPGAGALAAGGLTVSLDFIRIYRGVTPAGQPLTIFGVNPTSPGGLLVAASTRIPD